MITALILIASGMIGIAGGAALFFAWLWWDSYKVVRIMRRRQRAVLSGKGWAV